MEVIKGVKETFKHLKGIGAPSYYLGGDVELLDEHWKEDAVGLAFSAETYITNLIPKMEHLMNTSFK